MKISGLVENIFAVAVGLSQDGGFRNTIYAIDKEVYILNYDHTLLLRFLLRSSEAPFAEPVGFAANDYDSDQFELRNGKIVFITEKSGFIRKKTCGTSGTTPEEVRELCSRYTDSVEGEKVELNRSVLDLLDRDLSHVEFLGDEGETLRMIQRNIYDGTIIEIAQKSGGLLKSSLTASFGPIALKTTDFSALFSFQDQLLFTFPIGSKTDYVLVQSTDKNRRDMTGVVAACLYDEIADIKEARTGGEG